MTALLTLIRAVHFGSCLVLQSTFAVLFLVAIPGWDQAGRPLPRSQLYRPFHQLLLRCLFVAVGSGFLWLWLAIAGMSGVSLTEAFHLDLFRMVLTQTQPGHVWMLRAALALVLVFTFVFVPRTEHGWKVASWGLSFSAVVATLLTASLAWLGHAGASDGPEEYMQLAGDLLHLIAAGIWPAGLVPFAVFLRCALKERDPAALLAACVATRRFSALSLLTVAVLAVSGTVNSYYLVGTFHALISTDYGRLLLLKLVLFGATIAIGAWNLFLCKSRLAITAGSPPVGASDAALAKITRNVLIEIVLGTLILLVVGLLGITPPTGHL